ncbi:MAG: phage holin family protein [Gemmataceae bacterium]
MAKSNAEPDLPALLRDIAADARTLVGQQFDLFRTEVGSELRRAGGAAAAVAGGGGLTAAGGLLTGMAVAHLLHEAVGLPLWASYGLVGGAAAAGGATLLKRGRDRIAGVRLDQTAESLDENLSWLQAKLAPTT